MGSILKSEQALPFKYEMYQLARTYAKLAREAGVEFRLNTEVTAEYVEKDRSPTTWSSAAAWRAASAPSIWGRKARKSWCLLDANFFNPPRCINGREFI